MTRTVSYQCVLVEDLNACPQVKDRYGKKINLEKGECLVVPDIHANIKLMLHYLILSGAMVLAEDKKIAEKKWAELIKIIDAPMDLTTKEKINNYMESVNRFKKIINEATFSQENSILWLGDMLADRGQNDCWILLLLDGMNKARVNFQILYSNHDHDAFMWFKYHGPEEASDPLINASQCASLIFFKELYKACEQEHQSFRAELKKIYEEAYLPNLKLLSCCIMEDGRLLIAGHGPTSISLIWDIADSLCLSYVENDKDPKALIELIDACNNKFQELISKDPKAMIDKLFTRPDNSNEEQWPPLYRLIWGRGYEDSSERQQGNFTTAGQRVHVCGHCGPNADLIFNENIDNSNLGKLARSERPPYNCCNPNSTGFLFFATAPEGLLEPRTAPCAAASAAEGSSSQSAAQSGPQAAPVGQSSIFQLVSGLPQEHARPGTPPPPGNARRVTTV